MEIRIQYMRHVCTHYFPVPVIGQSLGNVNVCVCMPLCVYPPCIALALMSQNSQLSPTHVNAFLNIFRLWHPLQQLFYKHAPLTLLGLWYYAVGYPQVQILSLFHSASNCPHSSAHFHAWMPTSPWLASDFLHKSASPMLISASLDLDFYSACLASLLFNILWTKLTLVAGFSALWWPLNPTLALNTHDMSWDGNLFFLRSSCHISYYTPPLPVLVDLIVSPYLSSDFLY